jgi:hypothetical protein
MRPFLSSFLIRTAKGSRWRTEMDGWIGGYWDYWVV